MIDYLKKVFYRTILLIAIIMLIIGFRVFAFDICRINSISMKTTVFPGDIILINKVNYGITLPIRLSNIPWLKIFSQDDRSNYEVSLQNQSYHRLKSKQEIGRDDLLIFYNHKNDEQFLKRCIAIPKDTLFLSNNDVFINGKTCEYQKSIMLPYSIVYSDLQGFISLLDSLECYSSNNYHTPVDSIYIASLSSRQKGILLKSKTVESISLLNNKNPSKLINRNVWGQTTDRRDKTIGPIIIPYKGYTIANNNNHLASLCQLIKTFEEPHIHTNGDELFIDSKRLTEYTFKKDYYFVLGDNRFNSFDSRFWGLIPEEMIIGKTNLVIYSNRKGDYKHRLLRKIN